MIGLVRLGRARTHLRARAEDQRLLIGRYAALADLGLNALAAWPLKHHGFLRNVLLAVMNHS